MQEWNYGNGRHTALKADRLLSASSFWWTSSCSLQRTGVVEIVEKSKNRKQWSWNISYLQTEQLCVRAWRPLQRPITDKLVTTSLQPSALCSDTLQSNIFFFLHAPVHTQTLAPLCSCSLRPKAVEQLLSQCHKGDGDKGAGVCPWPELTFHCSPWTTGNWKL